MLILSCDHAGYDMMQKLMKYFNKKKIEYQYMGPTSYNPDDDYPDFITPASKLIAKNKDYKGIFFCGSGVGVNMVANRQRGVRAVCANNDYTIAYYARLHEDANVLTLGTRFTSYNMALKIIKIFLTTNFEGGRHLRRINKY